MCYYFTSHWLCKRTLGEEFLEVSRCAQETEALGEKLQAQLFQARDNADTERTQLVERASKAEAVLIDRTAELGMHLLLCLAPEISGVTGYFPN